MSSAAVTFDDELVIGIGEIDSTIHGLKPGCVKLADGGREVGTLQQCDEPTLQFSVRGDKAGATNLEQSSESCRAGLAPTA